MSEWQQWLTPVLLMVIIAMAAYIWRQLVIRLDRAEKSDNEQWALLRHHDREIGEIRGRIESSGRTTEGGD